MSDDWHVGDDATDGLNTGKIVQVLYLLEYQLWPGEPKQQVWRKPEDLHAPKPVAEQKQEKAA